jgi:hypothetical protein
MYKSPIEVIYGPMQTQIEGDVFRAVQSYGITVDKDELIKALAYDRNQYDAGYRDALATIVHCKDCQHCALSYNDKRFGEQTQPVRMCLLGGHVTTLDDYCSWAVRKDGADNE